MTEKKLSEKQIGILKKNGFTAEQILSMPYQEASDKIGELLGNAPKTSQAKSVGQIGATQGIAQVNHTFQSEYEFGPAGNRHKIKYNSVEELKAKMQELENAGLFMETEKI